MENEWELYILRCGDGTLYTGIARDADKRLAVHRSGKGAKYTRGRGPIEPVYHEPVEDRSAALRREWEIKHFTREEKRRLIEETEKRKDEDGQRTLHRIKKGVE